MAHTSPHLIFNKDSQSYLCSGDWSVETIASLYKKFADEMPPTGQKIIINGADIKKFDSAGALALSKFIQALQEQKNQVTCSNFSENQHKLLELIDSKQEYLQYQIPEPAAEGILYQIGKESENKLFQIDGLIILIGDLSCKFFEALGSFKRFQVPSIISIMESAGVKALPIVALLAFLIGIVLAYQMGLQLQTYGANIFIAYLSGMAVFREFAPLITAIIVAGRTSSAFTAQIGSMKVNEEVDALLTMGLSPTELLVMPKVIGLLLIFPLLIFWADMFGVLGAMIMSKSMLQINYVDFLQRLKDSVGLQQMMLGLYKAPAFALLISLVGCFQGFKVQASADDIGSQTTKSVVQALFLIIVADATYSIVYSWMKL
ncbi:MAG: ABC transporter permease [Legionella sp.]